MGEVYLARDPRLGREVAIKVLPPERLADETRRQRFIQEARAASALSHPNIVTIHEIEEAGGVDFIVMEYIRGRALEALIPRHGMRLSEAMGVAIPVADALARAHAAGIVHRDLKPANVMVGPGGVVKVLDFGLAKLTAPEDVAERATLTRARQLSPSLSGSGTIAGTLGYMSPEQATGGKVDARSDVFSFGALLYEMVTGQRAFAAGSSTATLAALLHGQPRAPSEVAPGLPRELDRLILRCLRKDPDRRFQHMSDVKVELLEVKEDWDSAEGVAARRVASKRPLLLAGVSIGLLLLASAAAWVFRSTRVAGLPPPRVIALTTTRGSETSPTFSPDGSQVAFAWDGEKSATSFDIWLKMVGGAESRQLSTDPAPDVAPSFSPDGEQIAFVRLGPGGAGTVHVVSPLGGADRKLSDFHAAPSQVSWSPNGRFLAAAAARPAEEAAPGARGIHAIPILGGASQPLTSGTPAGFHDNPAFSPDGRRLAYAACRGRSCDVEVVDLRPDLTPEGPPRRLTDHGLPVSGIAWVRDGKSIVYGSCLPTVCHLWRVGIAEGSRPERIELAGRAAAPATVPSRDRLAWSRSLSDVDVSRFVEGQTPEAVLASSFYDYGPDLSPDGKRIAFSSGRSGESQEIWVAGADGSNPLQLTHGPGQHQGLPRWSPDGRRLAFNSQGPDGHWDVWVIDADGGTARRLTEDPGDEQMPGWSRDGRFIYYNATSGAPGEGDVWRVPSAGGPAERLTRHGGDFSHEAFDGRALFFLRTPVDSPLVSIPLGGGPERVLVACVQHWGFDVVKEGVYYVGCAPGRTAAPLHLLDPATGRDRVLGRLETGRGLFLGMTVSQDGRTILFAKWVAEGADLMMIENFR
jgi:Tol biopolymer transport system component